MGHVMNPDGSESHRIWVFGYGSIMWKTGFKYSSKKVGYIKGFQRRFWQGNTTHRGTTDKPGRVAMLVEAENDEDMFVPRVWGVAFELVGAREIQHALEHLGVRECRLGGYITRVLPFYCKDNESKSPHDVLLFDATQENAFYQGPRPVEEMARQIVECKGAAGHNVEYVTKLADYVRQYIPEDNDSHLFNLDAQIRSILKEKDICLKCLIDQNLPKNTERKSIPLKRHVSKDYMPAAWSMKRVCDVHEDTRVAGLVTA